MAVRKILAPPHRLLLLLSSVSQPQTLYAQTDQTRTSNRLHRCPFVSAPVLLSLPFAPWWKEQTRCSHRRVPLLDVRSCFELLQSLSVPHLIVLSCREPLLFLYPVLFQ